MLRPWFVRLRSNKSQQPRRRVGFTPRFESLEVRQMLSTISVNVTSDVVNISPSETIPQVNANPPATGITLRDAIIAANNTGSGSVIDFTPLGQGSHTIAPSLQLPNITANGITIQVDTVNQEIVLNGLAAGNSVGLGLLGKNCTASGLAILNFESAGVLVEGNNDAVKSCSIGLDSVQAGPNGNGIYVLQNVGVLITNNNIENNTADGILVSMSANVGIGQNVLENNQNNGIRVAGMLPNSGQPFTTQIVDNQIDFNTLNGIDLLDCSNNYIGFAGSVEIGNANTIGSDKLGNPNKPNGGDGILIESSGSFHASNNHITENIIGGNNGNGVEMAGAGTSNNTLINNWIGWGFDNSNLTASPLPNELDGVAISGGANHNTIGGIGLFRNADPLNGSGNLIGPNLGNGVSLSGPGTSANVVSGNLIGTNKTGDSNMVAGIAVANGLFGVAVDQGATGNVIGGIGNPLSKKGLGNLISGNATGGVDINGVGTSSNTVAGNFIGTTVSGEVALPNIGNGVTIEQGATNNTVGSSNLISGNASNGVWITDQGTSGNVVRLNFIGTDNKGTKPLGNAEYGVLIANKATSNTIGDSSSTTVGSSGNLLSGNHLSGVAILDTGSTNNQVVSNLIGTDLHGNAAVGNSLSGVVVAADYTSLLRNLISGNIEGGVTLAGSHAVVQGNRIGTNLAGTSAVPNMINGITLFLHFVTGDNTIGGLGTNDGNLISGNGGNGILATGTASVGNLILGNKIGTDLTGEASAIPNQLDGVLINNISGFEIGGSAATAGNLISGNLQDGVKITGPLSKGILVANNRIGTDLKGVVAMPNQMNGVEISNQAHGNIVGSGNVISANDGDGIRIALNSNSNTVVGNLIGTNFSGDAPLGNLGNGVEILSGASQNKIGQVVSGGMVVGNVISANHLSGVAISGASYNLVQGNQIGTNKAGTTGLGNLDGVQIFNGSSNQIGGPGPLGTGGTNLISGNHRDGVRIWGGTAAMNVVASNLVGTDVTGQKAIGNTANGVFLFGGAQHNIIGEQNPLSGAANGGNVVAFNGAAGVAVGSSPTDTTTIHNPILYNSIFSNVGLGIDLGDDGVTQNSSGGPHSGPNELQNFPQIQSATAANSTTTVTITLNSIPKTDFLIQLFVNSTADPSGHGQGRTLVGTIPVTTDANGNVTIKFAILKNLKGQYLAATATALGAYFESSEFGKDFQVT